jgi:hypothetical protein
MQVKLQVAIPALTRATTIFTVIRLPGGWGKIFGIKNACRSSAKKYRGAITIQRLPLYVKTLISCKMNGCL